MSANAAASAKGISSGMRCRRPGDTRVTTSVANVAPPISNTRSPGAYPSTPSPTAVTTPAPSEPGTNGGSWRCW